MKTCELQEQATTIHTSCWLTAEQVVGSHQMLLSELFLAHFSLWSTLHILAHFPTEFL